MSSESVYQAIVIGAGPGGYPCAIRLAQLGIKTLIVEKDAWGGVCLNVGCIPSKALVTASKRFDELRHAADLGITVTGDVSIDMGALQGWKQGVVDKLVRGVGQLLKGNGVDRLRGTASLSGPGQVTVDTEEGTRVFTAEHIVLATGSSPIQVPGFSFSDDRILDSTGVLALSEVPKRLVVIGGGYVGLELGGVFAKLGSAVTVVEMMDQVLPGFDPEVIKLITRQLKKDGVRALTETRALGWERTDRGVAVEVEGPKGTESLEGDYVLVTVGRRPNTANLGLEALGVVMDGPFIKVDAQLRTNVAGLYAIGDVAGQPMLAHKATHEGEVVAEVIAGKPVAYDVRCVPAVVFTDPEIATVGLSEAEARDRGEVKVGKVPWAAVGRAIANNETQGFVKVVLDAETDRLLGVTILGYHASDLISEAALAIEMGALAQDVALTIHPHPTLGEGLMEACKAALGEAVHVMNR